MKNRTKQGVMKLFAVFVLICIVFNCGVSDVVSYLTEGLTVYAVEPTIVSSGNCGANGNNVKYTLDSEGTLIISGNGKMMDYEEPSNPSPFDSMSNMINKVIISDNVTFVSGFAFSMCNLIETIELSDSVSVIKSWDIGDDIGIFRNTSLQNINVSKNNEVFCSIDGVLFSKEAGNNLFLLQYPAGKSETEYSVPENVISIRSGAFEFCTHLKSILLPNDLLYIGDAAFNGSGIESIMIPEKIDRINNGLFAYCLNLKDVYMSKNIKEIGFYAFNDCDNLTDVYYGGTEEEWKKISIDYSFNPPLSNVKMHYSSSKNDYLDSYRIYHYPKIIEPGMTFQIGVAKLGGDFTGISLSETEKAEWVVNNPDRIKIIASKDSHTQAVMQALSIGDCDVTLKINGVPVCTETIHINLSEDTLVKRYKDCILNAPTFTSIKNGLRTSTEVLSELSGFDIQTATAFTMLSQKYLGIDMAIDNTAKYIKTGQYFSDSDDTILNQIIATYLALPQDDDYIAEFTKKYQLVYNTVQAGRSLNGVKENFFQQLSDATSFDSNSIKELFSSASDLDVFGKLGYIADTYISYKEISTAVLLIAQFDLDTINHLKATVSNADNGCNSSLYKALERLEKKIKSLDMYSNTEYLKATLKTVLSIVADALLDEFLPGSTLVISLANFLASIYENDGGIMLDDVTNLTVSLHFASIIYQSFINSTDGQELQYSFDFLKAATLVSLQCDVPIIEGKSKLKKYKNNVNKISDEIIKNCSFSKLLLEATESAQDKKATLSNSDVIEQFGVISQYGITTTEDQETSKSTSSGVSGTSSTSKSSDYLSIPSNKNGYSITEIAKEGYKGYNGTTIAIPDTVKKIGQEAFSECKNVQTVLLGSKLQTIEEKAFYNCVALEYISIPKSVQTIGKSAFENCSKLTVVTINAKSIGDKAFGGCKNLSRVYISNRQATIGKDVFKDCQKDLTIVGYSGSTSEIYAKANSIHFEAIKEYISNISISKSPTKKSYMLGEEVDTTGMELTVEYKDGTKKTVNSGWLISYDTTSYGNFDTYVIYGDSQTSYQIAVDSEPDIGLSFDTSKIEMLFGTEYSIAEKLKMNLPYDSIVTWSSDSPEVVSVDCFGLLKSLTPGKAIISAKIPYSNKIAECEVIVTDSITINSENSPKFIMFEPDNDGQYIFSANTTTSDTSLFIFDDQNQVINGTENLNVPFSCYFQNKPYIVKIITNEATKLNISGYSIPKYLSLINDSGKIVTEVSGYSGDFITVFVNSDEGDVVYYWESSNLSVADVDNGKIRLANSGMATITVRNSKNEIAKCKVVVLEKKPQVSVISDNSGGLSSDISSEVDVFSNNNEGSDNINSAQNNAFSAPNKASQSISNTIVIILLLIFLIVAIILIIVIVMKKKEKNKNTTT